MDSMIELAKANKFNGLEKPKQLYLHDDPFTIENDLLTPSMKTKRPVCAKYFRTQIDEMYSR